MRSWYAIRARAEGAEVSIYDEIGAYGVSAKSFLDEVGAVPSNGPLTLRLNSPGDSVFDAVAIYNALKRHAGPVSVWIDGIAASAASYVAMAGDEVVMPENAFLMIHDPSGLVMGTADDLRAMAEALDKIKGSLVAGYVSKSGGAEDDIAALMARETWLDAAEAVELGFADRMAEPVRIAASFDVERFRNAPPVLVEAVEASCDAACSGTEDGLAKSEEAAMEEAPTIAAPADDVVLEEVAEQASVSGAAEPPAPPGAAAAVPDAEAPGAEPAATDPAVSPAAIRAEVVAHAAAVITSARSPACRCRHAGSSKPAPTSRSCA
jgi:ATP-dependent Clp protease protease subunit